MYTYCEDELPLALHLISEELQMHPGATAHTGMLIYSNFPSFHHIPYYSRDSQSYAVQSKNSSLGTYME